MQKSIVWEGLHYDTEEHCNINYLDEAIIVRSELEGWALTIPVYVEYVLRLDLYWNVVELDINFTVGQTLFVYLLFRDAEGEWTDVDGKAFPEFKGCNYVDISLTPFTNTLPVKGSRWIQGQRQQTDVLYIDILANQLRKDTQYYTLLSPNNYRFENDGGNFTADIIVDEDGFVTHYPQLFEMLKPI